MNKSLKVSMKKNMKNLIKKKKMTVLINLKNKNKKKIIKKKKIIALINLINKKIMQYKINLIFKKNLICKRNFKYKIHMKNKNNLKSKTISIKKRIYNKLIRSSYNKQDSN